MSDTISLGFKLTGEADFKRALTDINNQLKLNASQMSLASAKYDENGKSVEALTAKNKLIKNSLDVEKQNIDTLKAAIEKSTSAHAAAGTQIEKLKTELAAAKTKMEEMGKSSDTAKEDLLKQQTVVKDLTKELKTAEKAYETTGKNTTNWGTQLNNSETKVISLNKQLGENEKQLKKVDVNTNSFSGKMADLGNKVSDTDEKLGGKLNKSIEAFGTAAVAAVALAIKSFSEFSQQMDKVSTLLDENVMSMEEAQKNVVSWSNQSVQSAGDVANAMYDALSSGVQTADVSKFMAQASQTAAAGNTDVSTSVDILTTVLNSYGMKVSEVTDVSDKLLLAQDKGKITVGEFSQGLGNLVGIASNAGVSLNEVLAGTAALSLGGLKGSSGITALKAAISNIIDPSAEATAQAKKLHIAFNAQALEATGLSGVLEQVKQKTGGSADKMAQLFGSTEALNAVMILTGKQSTTFKDTLSGMNNTGGKTQEVFDKISSSTGYKFRQSLEEMTNSILQLGIALTPLINALSGLFSVLGGIPAPVLIVIGTLFGMAAVVLQVIKAINTLSGVGGTVGKFFSGINVSALKTTAIILAVVAALTLLVAVIAVLVGKSGEVSSTLNSIGNSANKLKSTSSGAVGNNAKGTNNWRGGYTWVGEEGPEIVDLPAGTTIYPNGVMPKQKSISNLPSYALGTSASSGGAALVGEYGRELAVLPGTSTGSGTVINNYYMTIDAHNVDDFTRVVKLANGARQRKVQGGVS